MPISKRARRWTQLGLRATIRAAIAATITPAVMLATAFSNEAIAASPEPPAGPELTVVRTGDPASAVDLTPIATVGATASVTMRDVVIGASDGPMGPDPFEETVDAALTAEVIEAFPDGSYTTVATLTSIVADPAESEDSVSGLRSLDGLQGVPFTIATGPDGAGRTDVALGTVLTADQQAVVDVLSGPDELYLNRRPAGPVGVGATWTVVQPSPTQDTIGTVLYTYVLSSVDGDAYQVDVSYTIDWSAITVVDPAYEGITLTGTGTGTATIRGSLTDPLVGTVDEHVRHDLVVSDGQATATSSYDIWSSEISTPTGGPAVADGD